MKIQAIKQLCVKAKLCRLYTNGNGIPVWIGTEDAMFPIEGISVDEDGIQELFDLREKQMEKIRVETVPLLGSELQTSGEWQQDDEMRERDMLAIWTKNGLCRALESEGRMYMLSVEVTKPAEREMEYLRFYRAENAAGETLVVIYNGMNIAGVVRPEGQSAVEEVRKRMRYMTLLDVGRAYRVEDEKPEPEGEEVPGQMRMEEEVDE